MLVRALVAATERAGVERDRYLTEAGLATVNVDDIHGRIPLEDYRRAIRAAYRLSDDPAFGLHLGERMSMGTFDVIGHLSEHSANLRDALDATQRYSQIVTRESRVQFDELADSATIRFNLPESGTLEAMFTAEFSAISTLRLIRRFVGEEALPKRVLFIHAKPVHHAEYTRIFGGRERFSREFTGLKIERSWLDRTPACRETELHGYLQNRAEFLLAKVERDISMTERARRWLASQPQLARPTLEMVAHDLRISARSLRRHLQCEQTGFRALLDDARAAHAKRAMADPRCTIQDTAYALGFSTPSAFSRAFKRWTGVTPRDYRSEQP